MLNKFKTWAVGLFSLGFASLAHAVDPTDASTIASDLTGVLDSGIGIFNSVVTVVVAVCALGILISMVKKVKKG